jgi:hypothetical protein
MCERDIDIELSATDYQEEEPGESDERTPRSFSCIDELIEKENRLRLAYPLQCFVERQMSLFLVMIMKRGKKRSKEIKILT